MSIKKTQKRIRRKKNIKSKKLKGGDGNDETKVKHKNVQENINPLSEPTTQLRKNFEDSSKETGNTVVDGINKILTGPVKEEIEKVILNIVKRAATPLENRGATKTPGVLSKW